MYAPAGSPLRAPGRTHRPGDVGGVAPRVVPWSNGVACGHIHFLVIVADAAGDVGRLKNHPSVVCGLSAKSRVGEEQIRAVVPVETNSEVGMPKVAPRVIA